MTDTAPQIMQSRQLATVDPPTMQTAAMARMDAEFRMAQAIARAGADMLPRAYRDKPGAVILVQQWANAHEVDILTAMQTVSFVEGRPVIDATMQRAMAERAGYDVRITHADREKATVEVWRNDRHIGTATYTWEDGATAGLTGKNNWKKNPEDMLVARATTRALKRHAPSVMLGFVDPDDAGEPDMVEVLTQTATPTTESAPTTESEPTADVVDVEIVTEPEASPAPNPEPESASTDVPSDVDALKALIADKTVSTADTIREAQNIAKTLGHPEPSSVAKIASGPPEVLEQVTTWLLAQADNASAHDESPF